MDTPHPHTNRPGLQTADRAFTLATYAALAHEATWTRTDIYRAIVCNLPRRLHAMEPLARRHILRNGPPLTGTPWDALLAATAEHIAQRHGDPLQPWMDEPERFLETPWFASAQLHYMRWEALHFAPAAFVRHGTPIHPSDLDARGGDEPWTEPWTDDV